MTAIDLPTGSDRERYRAASWTSFLQWATNHVGMQQAFEAETGRAFNPGELEPFVTWATMTHWGWEEAPERWKALHPKPEGVG